MFKHYVKVAIRLIKRSFLFSSINMLGFIFGMIAAFMIYLWIVDELTFEDFQKNGDTIYRVIAVSPEADGSLGESPSTVAPLGKAFMESFPQIENATWVKYETKQSLQYGENTIEGVYQFADTTFFDVFSFPVVEGNTDNFKRGGEQIIITESVARKLFGTESAVGKQVLNVFYSQRNLYTIAAVVKVPRKSHIQFEILINALGPVFIPFNWGFRENIHTYVQFKENYTLSRNDRNAMARLMTDRTGENIALYFQPLKDIHLNTGFIDHCIPNHGNRTQIYLFGALAILIIFMGAFNFTTLSMARASLRYKEIGVRKVTGAKRKTLISQFLSESMVQAFLSLIIALALTELLLPLFNHMVDKDITLSFSWEIALYVLLGIFGVGCLAGSYPAFFLSSINPLLAFKGGSKTGRKGRFIQALVCVQFVIAITLILCTSIVFKQLSYMQNKDLGVEKENIVSIMTNLWYGVDDFKQEVLKNPHVKSVAMGGNISDYLGDYANAGRMVKWHTKAGTQDSLRMVDFWADGDFVTTYGIELLKGELFEADTKAYWDHTYTFPALINETAWKQMKIDNPIGMELEGGVWGFASARIVGIVKDFNFQPLKEEIKPMYMLFSPESLVWLHIKITPENKQETLKFLKEKYEEMNTGKVFTYQFFTDMLSESYAKENQQARVFLIFTILAILIAVMGVFGLVSLSTQQRIKEIGVRKVIGAHSDRIVKMFCLEYARWIGIAFLIACPLGYLFMFNWLGTFAYRTAMSWWLFPMAGLIVLLITLITVAAQTWRAASRNPVESLRYE